MAYHGDEPTVHSAYGTVDDFVEWARKIDEATGRNEEKRLPEDVLAAMEVIASEVRRHGGVPPVAVPFESGALMFLNDEWEKRLIVAPREGMTAEEMLDAASKDASRRPPKT